MYVKNKDKRYIARYVFFGLLISIGLLGCINTIGVPTPNAKKGEYYLFSKVGIVMKRSFSVDALEEPKKLNSRPESKKLDSYYQHQTVQALNESHYFSEVSMEKREYMIVFNLTQYNHTSYKEYYSTLLFSPVDAFLGVKQSLEIELKVTILNKGKVFETYRYSHLFEARKHDSILQLSSKYFDDFMQKWLNDMAGKSKIRKIKILN